MVLVIRPSVKKCTKFGKSCAPGRKCIPCYLRKGLCCRRAALLRKDYCGLKYKVYGKKCGTKYFKKGCYKVGNYCPDGKQCRKYKNGKLACVFKTKRPAAKHCRYGGKWCPKGLTCRQSIKKGVVIRRCVYIPKCKRAGQSCGIFKRKVCVKCGKKLCCRRGVTKPQCKKRCNVWWKQCSLKCRKGFIGWCCKPRKITKPQCLKRCKGKYKYCSKKGCAKGFLGYCCKTRPYISLKKCLHTCKGKYRYCSKNKCSKNIRGYCCKKRPVITKKKCKASCKSTGMYCVKKGCPKHYRGWCCLKMSCKGKKKC
ncbi:hypothetical protein FJT64_004221 [Amphibalanus amphitrite]|uniref:Uncharacterized protein n=1 Tax=Amphibalanus amphitrite TaxID=1232801 RepID=A0A6A4W8N4_AMPAM|nr:hypothetical protein FJT64_004221 [Amphibalanus amphitrite]